MAASVSAGLLSRLTNARNIVRTIGNNGNITSNLDRNLVLVTRKYSMDVNTADALLALDEDSTKPKKKLSKAMKAYLERAREYDAFIKKEVTEYEIGRRHLANMMGEDPETFSQEDVKKSIKYLFPSGLFVKFARPIMEHPSKVFPPRKAAQFDESGRPHHPFFYTCMPNYYQMLHDIVANINKLNSYEDQSIRNGVMPRPEDKLNTPDMALKTKVELENYLLETISDEDYDKFTAAAERLMEHPYSAQSKDFIEKMQKRQIRHTAKVSKPIFKYTPEGKPFITIPYSKRKTAIASVTVFGNGEGKITINGEDLRYFFDQQAREQPSEKNEVEIVAMEVTDMKI